MKERSLAAALAAATLCLGWSLAARAQMTLPDTSAPPDGATLFRNQCATCHSVKPGDAPRQGPNLFGVYGRKPGTAPGYHYSPGFAHADFVWDEPHLDAYLTNPQSVIPGAVMPYRQRKPEIRHAIITWLKGEK